MSRVDRQGVVVLVVAVVSLALCGAWIVQWRLWQSNAQYLQQASRGLDASLKESEARTHLQEQQLALLMTNENAPDFDAYIPALWLSSLQKSVHKLSAETEIKARLLADESTLVSRYKGAEIIAVPIEFEVLVASKNMAIELIKTVGDSLGSYVSVESYRIQSRHKSGQNASYFLQFRVIKYALKSGSP